MRLVVQDRPGQASPAPRRGRRRRSGRYAQSDGASRWLGLLHASGRPLASALAARRLSPLGLALARLADLARVRGDVEGAERLFTESLAVSAELGPFWRVVPRALSGLAGWRT